MVDYPADILGAMGNTPLVRIDRLRGGRAPTLLAKLEFYNPGGSVKDRIGISMLKAAMDEGKLRRGGTVVEPTSGNTGVGLAIAANLLGLHAVFTMPDKMSEEKRRLLRAYGAEVVICPTNVAPEDPRSYYVVARQLAAERNGFLPDQYSNPNNPLAHYRTTGPEIWRQTHGRITHLVAGAGTGGTISGAGRYLKEQNPKVQIVGVDPEGSMLSGGKVHPYKIEGIGEDMIPATIDLGLIDRWEVCSDRNAYLMARRVVKEEGFLIGSSGGAAIWGALQVCDGLSAEAVVVVIVPDGGDRYLSKLFNDAWMRDNGFLDDTSLTLLSVLEGKGDRIPQVVSVAPGASLKEAYRLMRTHDISQLPVLDEGRNVGLIEERALLARAMEDPKVLERPVSALMEAPLPEVQGGLSLEAAMRHFSKETPALLVSRAGTIIGLVSKGDIVERLAR